MVRSIAEAGSQSARATSVRQPGTLSPLIWQLYLDSLRSREKACVWRPAGFGGSMIRGGFLSEEDRKALIALACGNGGVLRESNPVASEVHLRQARV